MQFYHGMVNIHTMHHRNLSLRVAEALADTPAVFLRGPRQAGKTTLAQALAAARPGQDATYITLDNATALAAANQDPEGFLSGLSGLAVLDEVQRAPGLALALKQAIDQDRRPGRFLLTGSANLLALPRVADSLAGRMEVLTLWPLSQGEVLGLRESFIDRLFAGLPPRAQAPFPDRQGFCDLLARGGFPEPRSRATPARRAAWFEAYLTTLMERDVRDLAAIQDLGGLLRLLKLLGLRTASLLNVSEVSRTLGTPNATLARHLAVLEGLFLAVRIPAWAANPGKRLVKTPKIYLADPGLAAHLAGTDQHRLLAEPELTGRLLENFVVMELMKQAAWAETRVGFHHFRTSTGRETDLVLEDPAGRVVGVEVKLATGLAPRDLRGLKALRESAGEAFLAGVVLHTGEQVLPLGERMWSAPVSALWAAGGESPPTTPPRPSAARRSSRRSSPPWGGTGR